MSIFVSRAAAKIVRVPTGPRGPMGAPGGEITTNLAANTGATLIGWIRSAVGAVARTIADILGSRPLEPEDFGARADDSTFDNGPALAKMAAALNTKGGGAIAFKHGGTYWVGAQTLNGPTAPPFAAGTMRYAPVTPYPIEITGCTKPVVIHSNGATIKCRAGMRYGSFNADTTAFVGQATTADFAAAPYFAMVYIHDNSGPVSTVGLLQLDGNINAQTIGGGYGDTGVQLPMEGAMIQNNTGPVDCDFWSHHQGLDGVTYDGPGLLNQRENAKLGGEYHNNGRSGLSVVGANGLTLKHGFSSFSNGKGANGLSSNPAAGIDFESEGAKYVRNIAVHEPDIYDNAGPGWLGDVATNTSRIDTYGGSIVGTTGFSVWANRPYCRFHDTKIIGCVVNLFASAKESEAAQFHRCLITDDVSLSPTGAAYGSGSGFLLIDNASGTQNVLFDNCVIRKTKAGGASTNGSVGDLGTGAGWRLHNCVIENTTSNNFIVNGIYSGERTHIIGANTMPSPDADALFLFNAGPSLDSFLYENNVGGFVIALARHNASVDRATGKKLYYATATYDPPSLATATQQSTTVTVTGLAVGDQVTVSFSNALSGTRMWGEATAANTATVYHRNDTGGTVDLASGTLHVTGRQA